MTIPVHHTQYSIFNTRILNNGHFQIEHAIKIECAIQHAIKDPHQAKCSHIPQLALAPFCDRAWPLNLGEGNIGATSQGHFPPVVMISEVVIVIHYIVRS